MKRYIIFAGEKYEPSGGAFDYQDSFDTREEVNHWIGCNLDKFDWIHALDTKEETIIQVHKKEEEE